MELWGGRFGKHLVKTGLIPRTLGTSLNAALEFRQIADYGSAEVPLVDVERSLTEAEAFVAAVERLIPGGK